MTAPPIVSGALAFGFKAPSNTLFQRREAGPVVVAAARTPAKRRPVSGSTAKVSGDVVNDEVEVPFRPGSRLCRREAAAARDHVIATGVAALAEHDASVPVDELRVELAPGNTGGGDRGHVGTEGQAKQ